MRWILVCGLVALTGASLGCNDSECEKDADCTEVVCPDGTKRTTCKDDGTCFKIEDCSQTSGGW